jgi:hypothetical protein
VKPVNLARAARKTGQTPYTKGWRAPWRKGWGGFGDKHCRLARLAAQIEQEYLEIYLAETPSDRRSLWRAAKLAAIAEMQLDKFNVDGKVTVSRTTKPAGVAQRILSSLRRKDAVAPLNLASVVTQAHQSNGA